MHMEKRKASTGRERKAEQKKNTETEKTGDLDNMLLVGTLNPLGQQIVSLNSLKSGKLSIKKNTTTYHIENPY